MKGPQDLSGYVGRTIFSRIFPPITRAVLALYAGASGDTNPIHIDSDVARRAGFPDVFAQGMLPMAYLGQALTDAVPLQAIRSYSARFTAMTQLGAELVCSGRLVENIGCGPDAQARIALTAADQNGEVKLSGEALVTASSVEGLLG